MLKNTYFAQTIFKKFKCGKVDLMTNSNQYSEYLALRYTDSYVRNETSQYFYIAYVPTNYLTAL